MIKKDITIGQNTKIEKAFCENEVLNYVETSIDTNPIHRDIEYSKNTIFKGRIVPGLLVASLFGGMLGSTLPGKGTIHLGQTLAFKAPVFINELVTAYIEVKSIRKDKPIITFKTICYKSDNKVAIEGEAVVKLA